MAFCTTCGNEIEWVNSVVCTKCGVAIKKETSDTKWSTGAMVGLSIASIIIPLVGLVSGIYGLTKEAKRAQGGILLAIGILMTVGYMVTM